MLVHRPHRRDRNTRAVPGHFFMVTERSSGSVRRCSGVPTFLNEGLPGWLFGSSLPDPGRAVLRGAALPHEPADHRRLLQTKRYGRGVGGALTTIVIPTWAGWGRRSRRWGWCSTWCRAADQQDGGHVDRLRHHPHLHPVRRHVGGGGHRLPADGHHRDRHAVDRRRGERHGRRVGRWWITR